MGRKRAVWNGEKRTTWNGDEKAPWNDQGRKRGKVGKETWNN